MIVLGYISAVLIGLVLGLLGGGGSILTVPVLAYLFGLPAMIATMYSLFVVGTTSLVGAVGYLRAGLVDVRTGALFLFPSLFGVSLARRWLLPAIPLQIFQVDGFLLTKDRLILLAFAMVMGLASYFMLRAPQPQRVQTREKRWLISIYGLLAGAVVGFVGAGGGFLIIPVLVGLGKMEMKPAVGTSLLIIALSSLFGFIGDLVHTNSPDWLFLLSFTALSIAGVFLGMRMSKRISSTSLKRAFGLMILVVAVLILVKESFLQ